MHVIWKYDKKLRIGIRQKEHDIGIYKFATNI